MVGLRQDKCKTVGNTDSHEGCAVCRRLWESQHCAAQTAPSRSSPCSLHSAAGLADSQCQRGVHPHGHAGFEAGEILRDTVLLPGCAMLLHSDACPVPFIHGYRLLSAVIHAAMHSDTVWVCAGAGPGRHVPWPTFRRSCLLVEQHDLLLRVSLRDIRFAA